MKYKAGDKVRVRTFEDLEKSYGVDNYGGIPTHPNLNSIMKEFCGKEVTINQIVDNKFYRIEENRVWIWSDCMFEELNPTNSVIIVKQGAGYYLFLCDHDVPIGSNVLCDTMYGKKDGITVTPRFYADDKEYAELLKQFGTKESKMKKVIGIIEYKLFEGEKAE